MSRGSFRSFLLHLHPRLIPESSARTGFTWCLGGLAFWMFLWETATGCLLVLYYVPSESAAYASVQEIRHIVPYGFFVRNLHYWCGQAMVILVVLHMIRVFFTRSYSPPRQLNWVIGLALLLGTVLVDFTGYLLVWDDRAQWAWTIARNLLQSLPLAGNHVANVLFGPDDMSDLTLVRLYAWHVILLPGLLGVLTTWHFWRIRKDGGISVRL